MIKLITKIQTIYNVITGKTQHWVLFELSKSDLENLLTDANFELNVKYYGLHTYLIKKLVFKMAEDIRDTDLMLDRAIHRFKR